MPQRQNYSKDQVLTNLSLAWTNPDTSFIADEVFPRVGVNRVSGTYFTWDKSNLRAEHDERAPGTPANEIDFEMSELPFGPLVDHALKHKVTDERVRMSENALEPFKSATRILTEKSRIAKEIDAATKLAAADNGVTVSTASDRWDDPTSDPIGMLKDGFDATKRNALRRPNTLILGEETVRPLLDHPDVIDRLPDNALRTASLQTIADLVGVRRVLVGDAARNSAVKGADDDIDYIWGKNAFFVYANPTPALDDMSAAYTLELTNGYQIDRWYDNDIESTWVRIKRYYEQKITAQDAIYKLLTVVS